MRVCGRERARNEIMDAHSYEPCFSDNEVTRKRVTTENARGYGLIGIRKKLLDFPYIEKIYKSGASPEVAVRRRFI